MEQGPELNSLDVTDAVSCIYQCNYRYTRLVQLAGLYMGPAYPVAG